MFQFDCKKNPLTTVVPVTGQFKGLSSGPNVELQFSSESFFHAGLPAAGYNFLSQAFTHLSHFS